MRLWLVAAAVNGLIAVAMGAFAAHGLRALLAAPALDWIETGVRYEMWHALALLAVALLARAGHDVARRWLATAGWAFLIGTILFPGSLYLLALTGRHAFAWLTPIGGIAFIVGWAALIGYGAQRRVG